MSDGFVDLAQGRTHFQLAGPAGGPPVVLIHGFSTPLFVWDGTFEQLVDGGFRVLRYDLLGRGRSAKPERVYDRALFERQLGELLTAHELDPPVALVGLSMGGAIALGYTEHHPERVGRLALVVPDCFPSRHPVGDFLIRVPLLGSWLWRLLGRRLVLRRMAQVVSRQELVPGLREGCLPQLAEAGYLRALRSTLVHMPLCDVGVAARVGELAIPTLLVWGRSDRAIDFRLHQQIRAAIPHLELVAVEGAGHLPHLDAPDQVHSALGQFLLG